MSLSVACPRCQTWMEVGDDAVAQSRGGRVVYLTCEECGAKTTLAKATHEAERQRKEKAREEKRLQREATEKRNARLRAEQEAKERERRAEREARGEAARQEWFEEAGRVFGGLLGLGRRRRQRAKPKSARPWIVLVRNGMSRAERARLEDVVLHGETQGERIAARQRLRTARNERWIQLGTAAALAIMAIWMVTASILSERDQMRRVLQSMRDMQERQNRLIWSRGY